jgi:Na+-transporting NADH:ubiquinone oxidoreductase subunit B
MRKVIYALAPLVFASVYFFGWRALALLVVNILSGIFAEWLFKRKSKKPLTEAVFVSAILYTLTLPVRTPFWIGALGIFFGIVFGREVFGGFGRNVFNPALVARAFVYVSFPTQLTVQWTAAAKGGLGALTQFIGTPIDTLTTATPMIAYRNLGELPNIMDLLFGSVAGSLGETSHALILIGAIYLLVTKTASWELMLSTLVGFLIASTGFYAMGITEVMNPLYGLLSGGFLFGMVFMTTDPVTAPKTVEAKWIYGILIGVITVVIRGFALFSGGVMFAILIGNTFSPILDEMVKALKKPKKVGA